MIKIYFQDGNIAEWSKDDYTDYKYDGKCFIIIKDNEYVALYNIDQITAIVVNK